MFRPQIKVLDCTIRDGGLANDSHFDLQPVRAVYEACCQAHIDYVELGYRNSKEMFDPKEFGPWRFCDEDQLRKAVEGVDPRGTKVCIMQDAHKADAEDVLPADESVFVGTEDGLLRSAPGSRSYMVIRAPNDSYRYPRWEMEWRAWRSWCST